MKLTRFTLLIVILLLQIQLTAQNQQSVKNVILLIGDGMGLSQIYGAYTVAQDNLRIAQMPYTALSITRSLDNYTTDSAAGGTAIATGQRTNNGMVALTPDKKPLKSILKYANENGLATGMVVTCSVTHATPAAFLANVESRKLNDDIALDFLKTNIDLFVGGGLKYFNKRSDKLNLIDSLIKRNYFIANTLEDILNFNGSKLAGLIAENHLLKKSEGRGAYLELATQKAIDILKQNDKGFFLMVEGSQIDWGSHANDKDYTLEETLDFDKAVGVALDFATTNNETLVIVTADHETGGMTITNGDFKERTYDANFSTNEHSAVPVLIFAYGATAENFHGLINNTQIFDLMLKALNLKK